MLHQFAHATLVAQPQRLGGKPFKLYIVTQDAAGATTVPASDSAGALPRLEQGARLITGQTGNMEVTRWRIQREAPVAPRTLYNYQFSLTPDVGAKPVATACALTTLHKNDQLLTAFPAPTGNAITTPLSISGVAFDTVPDTHHLGPIRFTSFHTRTINTSPFTGQ